MAILYQCTIFHLPPHLVTTQLIYYNKIAPAQLMTALPLAQLPSLPPPVSLLLLLLLSTADSPL